MPSSALPDLSAYPVLLFDLDGVLTPTAEIHMRAWSELFTAELERRGVAEGYTDDDYFRYIDGKKRDDGVASLLASRGISLPLGDPADAPELETVWGLGNRKNAVFSRVLDQEGIDPYPGSLALIERLTAEGRVMGVVSSSKNAEWVLGAARLRDAFRVVVDGVVAGAEHLASKPAPDMFLDAARKLGADPARTAVFEDATSGVAAARAGDFGLVVGVDRGAGERALLEHGADVVVADLAEFLGEDA